MKQVAVEKRVDILIQIKSVMQLSTDYNYQHLTSYWISVKVTVNLPIYVSKYSVSVKKT